MKILFISEVDLDGMSGQNIATREIVNAFTETPNLELVLICPKPVTEHDLFKNIDKKKFLPKRKARSVIWHIRQQFSMWILLRKTIKLEKPDLIITRLGSSTIITPIIAWLSKIDYVLLVRGLMNFNYISKVPGTYYIGELIYKLNARIASTIYVAYSEIKDKLDICRKKEQSKSKVLPNAVDVKKFYPLNKIRARNELNLKLTEEDFVIGFAGSIKERHCLKELLNAVFELKVPVKVLIMGDGPELENLLRIVKINKMQHNVFFTGYIPHEQLNKYIATCDLMYGVIHPKFVENPIKCYEYLACGKPIITSEKEEMEFVKINKLGFLIKEVSTKEINRAIIEAYNYSEDDFSKLSERAVHYIKKYHTWQGFVDKILSDYNKL